MIDEALAKLCVDNLLSPVLLKRVTDHQRYLNAVARYVAMDDDDLYRVTEVCLRNLERLDDEHADPDTDLRIVLIPELWERQRPGSRDVLRRVSTNLAEYDPDPDRPSFWRRSRLWSAEREERLRASADDLRKSIAAAGRLDVRALVERMRFAIAGSGAADKWPPDTSVYEPGFTYQVVPVVAWRAWCRFVLAPDGSRRTSVAMHDSIVAEMEGERCRQLGPRPDGGYARCALRADHVLAGEHHFSVDALVEWACYSADRARCSGKRSALAREHIGDEPAPGGQLA